MRVVLVYGLLWALCGSARAAEWEERERLVLERAGTRATVREVERVAFFVDERPVLARAVEVTLARRGKTATWRWEEGGLDPEQTGWPRAEVRETRGGPFLFVRTYSGGAHCCWGLLVFDLRRLESRGLQLASARSIELAKGPRACPLRAVGAFLPAKGGPPQRGRRCFAGGRFADPGARGLTPPRRVDR